MSRVDELVERLCPDGVEYRPLGEVGECIAGATPKKGVDAYWSGGTIPWMSSGEVNKRIICETEGRITQAGYDSCSTRMVPIDSVVIALAGQGKTRGTVTLTRTPLCTNQSLCSIVAGEDVCSTVSTFKIRAIDSDFFEDDSL